VSDLREALAKRGLSTEGLKAELVNRLQEQLDLEEFGGDAIAVDESKVMSAPPVSVTASSPIAATTAPTRQYEEKTAKEAAASVTLKEDKKVNIAAEKEEKKSKPSKVTKAPTEVSITETQTSAVKKIESVIVPVSQVSIEDAEAPTSIPTGHTTNIDVQKDMTFAEKKVLRAARFNLPIVENSTDKKSVSTTAKAQKNKRKSSAEKQPLVKQEESAQTKANKRAKKSESEQPVLPIDEIDKRLKRANKFGTSNPAETDTLKAMKRAHRFHSAQNHNEKEADKDKKKKNTKNQEGKDITASTATSLSKEEIEKRIKRAEKFGTSDSQELDRLKAMLRAYRFQKE